MQSIDPMLKLRSNINNIDEKIINLIKQRESISIQIAKIKLDKKIKIRDKTREKELLFNIIKLATEKNINTDFVNKIFKIIINYSIFIQKLFFEKNHKLNKNKLFYLGPKGSYSYIAAQKYEKTYFKQYVKYACINFKNIIKKTEENNNNYAILPMENTSSGLINEVYDVLENTSLYIIKEIDLPIQHCLLALKNTNIQNINTLFTHYQPFLQCNKFIKKYPNWKIKYKNSSTDAMYHIFKQQNHQFAALGHEKSGKIYNLHVIKKNISNQINNTTKFIILSHHMKEIKNQNNMKTILLIHIKKNSDNIQKILSIFHKEKIKITNFISRTSITQPLLNTIYITFLKNCDLVEIKNILKYLHNITESIKILGYYDIEKINQQ
ncbi:Bifunctional chorismate mutase/prephenate dehydratase [Buchnera aphidicola (Eriosoma grossulariae)]|uniref:prephenate dehydratase domain-containing protein n=1 Tax=Buchnera aphidicola TaxID=9 RepID=UPI0034641255